MAAAKKKLIPKAVVDIREVMENQRKDPQPLGAIIEKDDSREYCPKLFVSRTGTGGVCISDLSLDILADEDHGYQREDYNIIRLSEAQLKDLLYAISSLELSD